MAEQREVTEADVRIWPGSTPANVRGYEDIDDASAVIEHLEDGTPVYRVPWQPNEVEVAQLAHGGTIWLSMIGRLYPHRIDVTVE